MSETADTAADATLAPLSVEFLGGVLLAVTFLTVGRVLDKRLHRD